MSRDFRQHRTWASVRAGGRLPYRVGHVRLTAAGVALLPIARDVLEQVKSVLWRLGEATRPQRSTVFLGLPAGQQLWFGIQPLSAGVFGVPVGVAVIGILSLFQRRKATAA